MMMTLIYLCLWSGWRNCKAAWVTWSRNGKNYRFAEMSAD